VNDELRMKNKFDDPLRAAASAMLLHQKQVATPTLVCLLNNFPKR